MYSPTTSELLEQSELHAALPEVLKSFNPRPDFVVLGGDWNASLDRHVGTANRAMAEADEGFRKMVETSHLRRVTGAHPTFHHMSLAAYQSTLDYIFVGPTAAPLQYTYCIHPSPDPRHDHMVVRAQILGLPASPLPTLQQLVKPIRLRMERLPEHQEQLVEQVRAKLDMLPENDATVRLVNAISAAVAVAKELLGTTGGAIRIPGPRLSTEMLRLRDEHRVLTTAIRDLVRITMHHQRCTGALRKVWSMQIVPSAPRKKIWVLEQLTNPQQAAWVADWLIVMRTARTVRTEAMRALQTDEARDQADKARAAAIQRMSTPGSREVKRWLGGSIEPVSLHFLKANHPDTLLTETLPAEIKNALIEASVTCAERCTDTGSTLLIEGIRPSLCVFLLRILEGLP